MGELGVEHFGRRTTGAHPDLDADVQLIGVRSHLAQILVVETAQETDLGKMDQFRSQARAVVEGFDRGPFLRAHAEQVHAQAGAGVRRAHQHRRQRSSQEKLSTSHVSRPS
jgi:hypothetical protein